MKSPTSKPKRMNEAPTSDTTQQIKSNVEEWYSDTLHGAYLEGIEKGRKQAFKEVEKVIDIIWEDWFEDTTNSPYMIVRVLKSKIKEMKK